MTIKELYEKLYLTEKSISPDTLIQLYEENLIMIENQDLHVDNDEYNAVMRLTADYAHNLKIKESYSKALPYLNKAIDLFDNYYSLDISKLNDLEFYRILRFDRGACNYFKKDYSNSMLDFLWLSKNNPDNDVFKNWISSIKYQKYNFIIKVLWYVIAASVVVISLTSKKTIGVLYDIVLYIGGFALLISLIFETIKYINKRKINAA